MVLTAVEGVGDPVRPNVDTRDGDRPTLLLRLPNLGGKERSRPVSAKRSSTRREPRRPRVTYLSEMNKEEVRRTLRRQFMFLFTDVFLLTKGSNRTVRHGGERGAGRARPGGEVEPDTREG